MQGAAKSARPGVLLKACMLLLCLGQAVQAQAMFPVAGDLQVHGFLSQGVVFTSSNNFLGSSHDGSLDFREAGVNLSWRPHTDWQLSAQALSHRSGELDDGNPRLDYAMLDWTMLSAASGRAGIRLGRVKNHYGLYNTTRDVAFTRPSVLLPQSIYFEAARNLEMSADGLEAYFERYGDSGTWYLRYGAGYGQVEDRAIEAAFLGRNFPGHFESNLLQLVNLSYEGDNGRYVLGLTSVWGSMDYARKTSDPLQEGRGYFHPVIVSAQYNAEKWSLTAEHFLEYLEFRGFGPAFANGSAVAQSYYVQGSYRPAPRWETFLRYDVFYPNRDDRDGKKFAMATGLPEYMGYAKDWTLGLRYDVTTHFMLRAEYHSVNGTAWLSSLENPNPLALERRWDMFMLLGSFHF